MSNKRPFPFLFLLDSTPLVIGVSITFPVDFPAKTDGSPDIVSSTIGVIFIAVFIKIAPPGIVGVNVASFLNIPRLSPNGLLGVIEECDIILIVVSCGFTPPVIVRVISASSLDLPKLTPNGLRAAKFGAIISGVILGTDWVLSFSGS